MNLSQPTSDYSAAFRQGVGRRMKCVRVAIGKTQDEFAELVGITRQTLASYENGHSEPLSSILFRLCEDLNVDPAWLLTGDVTRPMFANQKAGAA